MLNLFVGLDIYTGLLLLLALAFVLFYEAINGFHDTANAVATVIYTRAMQPQLAVVMAAFFNFFGVYSAAIFLIPICISFDTAEKRRYATYLILNRRFSFEF